MDDFAGYLDGQGEGQRRWVGRHDGSMQAPPGSANAALSGTGHKEVVPAEERLPAVLGRPTILAPGNPLADEDSLTWWLRLYWGLHVDGAPVETARAKGRDLKAFARFFVVEVGSDRVDDWTPSVSRSFCAHLSTTASKRSGKPLTATTINRVCASVRHFGRWLQRKRLPCDNTQATTTTL